MMLARLTTLLAVLGGLVLLAAAGVVVASISLRSFADGQVSGDFEIVQAATALAAFAFLPFCQARRGNIIVDTFTNQLSPKVQRGLDALWDLVYASAAGVMAWQLGRGAYDTITSNTVSMVLGLPYGWAIAACAVMAGLLAIVSLATAIARIRADA
jgi:TRAP-type C4-dicarboxylate transport system permease small subunit